MRNLCPDVVVSCSESAGRFGRRLADLLERPYLHTELAKYESTGEWSARTAASEAPRSALLVAKLAPGDHDGIYSTILVANGLVDGGCGDVDLLTPYLPYSRSDRATAPLEPVGRDVIVATLRSAGLRRIFALDLHGGDQADLTHGLSSVPTSHLLLEEARRLAADATIVLPDPGADQRLGPALRASGVRPLSFHKVRVDDSRVVTEAADGPPAGAAGTAVILDDALFTGATHSSVASKLRAMGFDAVHLVVTHAFPGPETFGALRDSGVSSLSHCDTSGRHEGEAEIPVRTLAWVETAARFILAASSGEASHAD